MWKRRFISAVWVKSSCAASIAAMPAKIEKLLHTPTKNIECRRERQLRRSKHSTMTMALPPILSGLDAVAIQAVCGKALDEVFTLLHEPGGGEA